MTSSVVFLINGGMGSAMAERAHSLAAGLQTAYDVRFCYRSDQKVRSIGQFLRRLLKVQPRVVYVMDMAYTGVIAAMLYRLLRGTRTRVVIDTGDAIHELSKSLNRGIVGRVATWLLETVSLRAADHIVVRGRYHRELLGTRGIRSTWVPDGVNTAEFVPAAAAGEAIRARLGWSDSLVVGLVGSAVWSDRLQMCYGWELVEAIGLLKDRTIHGILVGDGSGIERLQERCRQLGVGERVCFAGRLPYDQLPEWLAAMDVCISTQTDDIAGRVRTTGKLPLYLAAGRHILATAVGEARRILPAEMLIPYNGIKDEGYPRRLASRLDELLGERARFRRHDDRLVQLARTHFEYAMLSARVKSVVDALVGGRLEAVSTGESPTGS